LKIAVVGATGHVGRDVVAQAAAAGHEVIAIARHPESIDASSGRITAVVADSTDSSALSGAIGGADAVISVLGHVKGSPANLLALSATALIAAMHGVGVRRLVHLGNPSVHEPGDGKAPLLAVPLLKLVDSSAMGRDHIEAARIVSESDLEWTVVRSATMKDAAPTGDVHVGDYAPMHTIARGDVATFLLRCAAGGEFVHETPFVSAGGGAG
jgi:putative NADH-flavin reductase